LRVNGQWLTADQRREDFEQAVAQRKDLGKWRPVMQEIANGLTRRGQKARETAQARLLAIDDPAAIGAMEEVISPVGEDAAKMVVEAFARMVQHEASVALARQAVYSPHDSVRKLACEKLRDRPSESYVPELLGSLQTPVVSRSQIFRGRGGSLVCRQVVSREGQDHRDVAVLETQYNRVALPTGSRDESLARALADMRRTQNARDVAMSRENEETMLLNLRLMQTLEAATGETLPPDPQDWWDWWNQENEVFVQTDKAVRQTVHQDQVTIVDRPTIPTGGQGTGGGEGRQTATPRIRFTPSTSCDCLAAGTKVWTDQGALAIEDIHVGDRVLAQDPDTGELMYKPVLGTTVRPASQLVRIEAGQDSVTTSGGHLYWVAGDGWRKARELNSGEEIHSVRGSVRISRVEKAEFAPTYNLIVADFSTYFVGHGLLMCHDNTLRQPSNAVVPGLSEH
jgi:hypothetical protein